MDTPYDDTSPSNSGDEFDRLLEQSNEAVVINRLAEQMSRDNSQAIFDTVCDMCGYERPVAGTERYQAARAQIHARQLEKLAETLRTGHFESGDKEEMEQRILDDLDIQADFSFDAERVAAEMAVVMIQHINDMNRVASVSPEYKEHRKREVFAAIVIRLNIAKDNPVIAVVNLAVPGDTIDLSSPDMDLYYLEAQERSMEQAKKIEQLAVVMERAYEIAYQSDEISESDQGSVVSITFRLTDEFQRILIDKDISLHSRTQQLDILALQSPLGYKTALRLLELVKENLDVYKL